MIIQVNSIENFFHGVLFVSRCLQSKTRLPTKLNLALQQRWGWELQGQIHHKKGWFFLSVWIGKVSRGLTCRKFQNVGSWSFRIYDLNSIFSSQRLTFVNATLIRCNFGQKQHNCAKLPHGHVDSYTVMDVRKNCLE